MAATLPYLASYKNVGELFDRIASAKKPEAFSTTFLYQTIGLKSKADRPLIPFLKELGFLDASGKPTDQYDLLKNPSKSGVAIAKAIHRAYAPLFAANEEAHALSGAALKGLIAQVAGTDETMTRKVAGTFNALLKKADPAGFGQGIDEELEEEDAGGSPLGGEVEIPAGGARPKLRTEFRYDIHVHLPSHGSEETYLNIFNALRKVFE